MGFKDSVELKIHWHYGALSFCEFGTGKNSSVNYGLKRLNPFVTSIHMTQISFCLAVGSSVFQVLRIGVARRSCKLKE